MPYQTTQPIMAQSVGFVRGARKSIGKHELPPALFDALVKEGAIVEVSPPPQPQAEDEVASEPSGLSELTNAELRERLAEAGLSTNGKKSELVARLEGVSDA